MDIEDTQQLLVEVGRFAKGRIATLAARPEHPIEASALDQLTLEARELGILPNSTADNGFSIWEENDNVNAMTFNLGALRSIAYASPGVAFRWHRLALARFTASQLGYVLDETELMGTVLATTGHYGLARTSLAKLLSAADFQSDDANMLADWLNRADHQTTLYAHRGWTSVIWPVWSHGEIAWQHIQRSEMDVTLDSTQHGFDELAGFSCSADLSCGEIIRIDTEQTLKAYVRILKVDMLGMLAIGAGALDRGQTLATEYASIRKQGGKLISHHPAVQHMLSEIEIALQNVNMALAAFARPVDELDMVAVAATRATIAPALCHAASQVLQVHGGIGYMRDAGPEKILRDQNMLKLIAGGTTDLRSFISSWNGVNK